jgi:hypothetical protein
MDYQQIAWLVHHLGGEWKACRQYRLLEQLDGDRVG